MRHCLAIIAVTAALAQAQLPHVAVLDLTSASLPPADLQALSSVLLDELYSSGGFDIVDRSRLQDALREQGLALSGAVDESHAAAAGKVLGAQQLLFGAAERARGGYLVSLRLVDVATLRIVRVASQQQAGSLRSLLKTGVKALVRKLTGDDSDAIGLEFTFVGLRAGHAFSVKAGDTLRTGDRIHLVIKPTRRCFVYIVNQDARGEIYTLFPNPTQRFSALAPDEEYHIPPAGKSFELNDVLGTEYLYVTASLAPLDDIDSLLFSGVQQAARREGLLAAMQTRGFAAIVDGDTTSVPLDNGVVFSGNLDKLMGSGTFHHTITFVHTAPAK